MNRVRLDRLIVGRVPAHGTAALKWAAPFVTRIQWIGLACEDVDLDSLRVVSLRVHGLEQLACVPATLPATLFDAGRSMEEVGDLALDTLQVAGLLTLVLENLSDKDALVSCRLIGVSLTS
jgi:hypothetical protein